VAGGAQPTRTGIAAIRKQQQANKPLLLAPIRDLRINPGEQTIANSSKRKATAAARHPQAVVSQVVLRRKLQSRR